MIVLYSTLIYEYNLFLNVKNKNECMPLQKINLKLNPIHKITVNYLPARNTLITKQ